MKKSMLFHFSTQAIGSIANIAKEKNGERERDGGRKGERKSTPGMWSSCYFHAKLKHRTKGSTDELAIWALYYYKW